MNRPFASIHSAGSLAMADASLPSAFASYATYTAARFGSAASVALRSSTVSARCPKSPATCCVAMMRAVSIAFEFDSRICDAATSASRASASSAMISRWANFSLAPQARIAARTIAPGSTPRSSNLPTSELTKGIDLAVASVRAMDGW